MRSHFIIVGFHMNTLNMIRQSPKKQIDLSNQFSQMEHSSLSITWMYSSTVFFNRGVGRYLELHIYKAMDTLEDPGLLSCPIIHKL